jgi:hypothetical protein
LTIDLTVPGKAILSQFGLLNDLLNYYQVNRNSPYATPARTDLFEDTSDSPALSNLGKSSFHSIVATLLFVAKRTRPDILLAVNTLSTKTLNPTKKDRDALERLLSYIAGTIDMPMILYPSHTDEDLRESIDAAFGVHFDWKSHTGATISYKGARVYSKSSKQKEFAKSSTDSEIYGVSNTLGEGIWCKNYLEAQGEIIAHLIVEQDNMSAIALFKRGHSNSEKTRHINIRHFWIADQVENGIVQIVYTPTAEVTADILTKPLQGPQFRKLRAKLLGHDFE